jgi:X-X-X-Leu-X-X-Gly heptad repeat protein
MQHLSDSSSTSAEKRSAETITQVPCASIRFHKRKANLAKLQDGLAKLQDGIDAGDDRGTRSNWCRIGLEGLCAVGLARAANGDIPGMLSAS